MLVERKYESIGFSKTGQMLQEEILLEIDL